MLKELKNIDNRNARFYASVVMYFKNDKYISSDGEIKGKIIDEMKGDKGFGYDPILFRRI